MTEPSWIDAMQEEIHEFERLEVLELVPCTVDPTLFTRQVGNDLLLIQIYVNDIIFASTNTAMCNEFANQITTKFKMSMMGQMLIARIRQKPIEKHIQAGNGSICDTLRNHQHGSQVLDGHRYVTKQHRQMMDHGVLDLRRSTSGSAQFLDRFNFLIEKLGMKSMSPETLKHLAEETDE
ncbi:retrovirus-related pol polyprotein from transposon TNT 1-94 [Tanacetum coccineum]